MAGFLKEICAIVATTIGGDKAIQPRMVITSADGRSSGSDGARVDVVLGVPVVEGSGEANALGAPFYYVILALMARTDKGVLGLSDLSGGHICDVSQDTSSSATLKSWVAFRAPNASVTVLKNTPNDVGLIDEIPKGACDAVAGDLLRLRGLRKALNGKGGDWRILEEPLGVVGLTFSVSKRDRLYVAIRQVMNGLLVLEEELDVSDGVSPLGATGLGRLVAAQEAQIGRDLGFRPDWIRKGLASTGSYDAIFRRSFQSYLGKEDRLGVNDLWSRGGMLTGEVVGNQ